MVATFFQILFAALSTACLLALALYTYLLSRPASLTVYSSFDKRLSSPSRVAVLAFAAIGFLVCIFQGADSMLFWMPDTWGGFDEDGKRVPLSGSITFWFTATVGLYLIVFISGAVVRAHAGRLAQIKSTELWHIVECSLNDVELASLAAQYERKIAELDAKIQLEVERGRIGYGARHVLPAGQTRITYSDLLDLAKQQRERLAQRTQVAGQRPT